MNIIPHLRDFNLSLQIDEVELPLKRHPDRLFTHVRVRVTDSTPLTPTVYEWTHLASSAPKTLEELAVRTLVAQAPRHPALKSWREVQGHTPVLMREPVIEHCGEAIHTAMRKLCDSPQSTIQWHAIHHMHAEDWSDLLAETRQVLRAAVAEAAPNPVTRRVVGMRLKSTWQETCLALSRYEDRERTALQDFALLALGNAVAAGDTDEFVWSWTGYLCEDIETDTETGEQQASADKAVAETSPQV